ncbi:Mur ligase domain-containing protein [bacterium]|nr:Mur ligase domain-containing protein [bacterium]
MGLWPAPWPRSAHFIGVGGVAMSALATVLKARGVDVRGSDRALYPPASDVLAAAGIELRTPFAAANLDPAPDLVVVGNAVSRGNPELERALDERLPLAAMAEVIERLLVPGKRVVAVAGTHGKTTTSSVVAFLLDAAGRDPSFIVGGAPGNFASGGRLGAGPELVLEADEYDTAFFDKGPKFLHYWPEVAVLGPVEFDHADIYDDEAAVLRAFSWFVRLVPAGGTLVVHGDDPRAARLADAARCRVVRVGLGEGAALRAEGLVEDEAGQTFRVVADGREAGTARFALWGAHNARNALAALAAAAAAGAPLEEAARSLAGFRPPRRRLELIGRADGAAVYDDFAHHPTAIAATLAALRRRTPATGRLVACVEPRSNTMVRSFFQERLVDALAAADVVYLGAVDRPERFGDGERLDVARLAAELGARGVAAAGPLAPAEIAERVLRDLRPGDRVALMSNGAFGGLAGTLRARMGGVA